MQTDRKPISIDDIVKMTPPAIRTAGAILPIFQRENLHEHVNYLIKEDQAIAKYVGSNPLYRDMLYQIADEKYSLYRSSIAGAKFIDSFDRVTSGLSEIAETFPGAGQAVSFLEEGIEMIPKLIYAPIYAKATGDYTSLLYFATSEVASFIPVVGDIIDMQNLYVDRARKTFRKSVADEFFKRVSLQRSALN